MSPVSVELKAFRQFLDERIVRGENLTPEQALAAWRVIDVDRREAIEAVREGLDDVEAGRIRPLDEFDKEFRARHGLAGGA